VLSILARGDRVIATGRNTDKLKQLVSSVKSELADNIRTVQLDVTEDEEEIKVKIDQAAELWGCIDVLVNNAGAIFVERQYPMLTLIQLGIGLLGILEEAGYVSLNLSPFLRTQKPSYSTKYLRRQFETNVFGLMDVTNATLPYLRKAKDGCVVVFGSRSAWRPEVPVSDFPF
jgi:NADP-dependent 3-hydroxy acid dehydrogenase YdfG